MSWTVGLRQRISGAGRSWLPRGGIARSLAVVGGATALGQGAIVLAAPLLARLYDPQAFGLLSLYAAVLAILVAVSSLRFDVAIPIAADPIEAVHLLALSVLLALGMSIAVGLGLVVLGTSLTSALGATALHPFLWILPIALFAASAAQALSSWAVYHRLFPSLARMKAIQGVAQAASQAAFGVTNAGPFGLILGDTVGRVLGAEQLLGSLRATLRSTAISLPIVRRCAREHWAFARVMTAASLVNALALQVPFLLIPVLFDLESSGQYFLAYRVLILPASLLAAAVSQVFFGEASLRRGDQQQLHRLARNAAVCLLVFSIPTYAIAAVAGQALIVAVFGHQWETAGLYAQILAPWLMLWCVASPISALLLVGRRERESLAFTTLELGLKVASLGIGAMLGSLTAGVIILAGMGVLLELAALWRFLRVASVGLRELIRPGGRVAALTLPSLVLVGMVGIMIPGLVALTAALGWVLAFGLAARFSPELRAMLSATDD
jgi:lipopolysaccharide exporter